MGRKGEKGREGRRKKSNKCPVDKYPEYSSVKSQVKRSGTWPRKLSNHQSRHQQERNLWTPFTSNCLGSLDIPGRLVRFFFLTNLSADSLTPNKEDRGRIL